MKGQPCSSHSNLLTWLKGCRVGRGVERMKGTRCEVAVCVEEKNVKLLECSRALLWWSGNIGGPPQSWPMCQAGIKTHKTILLPGRTEEIGFGFIFSALSRMFLSCWHTVQWMWSLIVWSWMNLVGIFELNLWIYCRLCFFCKRIKRLHAFLLRWKSAYTKTFTTVMLTIIMSFIQTKLLVNFTHHNHTMHLTMCI